MKESIIRDQAVLDALDNCIRQAPEFGICADTFAVLKDEFQRVMEERDAAKIQCENQKNHIRALLQANESLRLAWKPIAEYPPKVGETYLITDGDIVMRGWIRPDGVWKYGIDSNERFDHLTARPVTHLMPIPAPPKKEVNE